MPKRKIIWTKLAVRQLNAAIKFIRKSSEQNADSVKERIFAKVDELANEKVVHRKDSYKKDNDGNYLYFEILKYRIVYYRQVNEVFIIRLRHVNKEPKKY